LLKIVIQTCKRLVAKNKIQTTFPIYISIQQKYNALTDLAFEELLPPFSGLLPLYEPDQKMKKKKLIPDCLITIFMKKRDKLNTATNL